MRLARVGEAGFECPIVIDDDGSVYNLAGITDAIDCSFLVPASEVDPHNLDMNLWVNDELRQSSNTSDMIFDVNYVVWYLSQFIVLEPGDTINTGTPSDVALGLPGNPYLRAGDEIRLSIEGLGEQRQRIVAA